MAWWRPRRTTNCIGTISTPARSRTSSGPWPGWWPTRTDPRLLGLENLSSQTWTAQLRDGRRLEIPPGQRCNLAATAGLHTEAGPIEVAR